MSISELKKRYDTIASEHSKCRKALLEFAPTDSLTKKQYGDEIKRLKTSVQLLAKKEEEAYKELIAAKKKELD